MSKTLAEELAHEEELARRRFVHHTRPRGPLSMAEAIALHKRMEGAQVVETTELKGKLREEK